MDPRFIDWALIIVIHDEEIEDMSQLQVVNFNNV